MITGQEEFLEIVKRKDAALSGQKFPCQVFSSQFCKFFYFQFGLTYGPNFWRFVVALSSVVGDTSIAVYSLDPEGDSPFYLRFGMYGAEMVSTDMTEAEYYESLKLNPNGAPIDGLLYVPDLAWFPTSGEWCIYSERDLGIAILGLRETVSVDVEAIAQQAGLTTWMRDEALTGLVSSNFSEPSAFEEFETQFKQAYPPEDADAQG